MTIIRLKEYDENMLKHKKYGRIPGIRMWLVVAVLPLLIRGSNSSRSMQGRLFKEIHLILVYLSEKWIYFTL